MLFPLFALLLCLFVEETEESSGMIVGESGHILQGPEKIQSDLRIERYMIHSQDHIHLAETSSKPALMLKKSLEYNGLEQRIYQERNGTPGDGQRHMQAVRRERGSEQHKRAHGPQGGGKNDELVSRQERMPEQQENVCGHHDLTDLPLKGLERIEKPRTRREPESDGLDHSNEGPKVESHDRHGKVRLARTGVVSPGNSREHILPVDEVVDMVRVDTKAHVLARVDIEARLCNTCSSPSVIQGVAADHIGGRWIAFFCKHCAPRLGVRQNAQVPVQWPTPNNATGEKNESAKYTMLPLYKRCRKCRRYATYGPPLGVRKCMHCRLHMMPGEIDVIHRKLCQHTEGCTLRPCFSLPGDTMARFCMAHRDKQHVDVVHEGRCRWRGFLNERCRKRPIFGTVVSQLF